MPNRIIKESICYSDDIDNLTPFEETVFYRLIVRCDDYGRLDARPSFLRSMLFATKKGITEKNIDEAVARLASLGLVRLYEVDGKSFLMFPKWHLHQRVRDSKGKYPSPPINDHSPQLAATCGESPPESQSQSQSQSELNISPVPQETERVDERIVDIKKAFIATYELYPRHEGKAKGLLSYKAFLKGVKEIAGIKYRLNHQQIYFAVQAYAEKCIGRDEQYIQHFDTFMNGPVIDFAEKTNTEYEAFMLSKYGEEWPKIRFSYKGG